MRQRLAILAMLVGSAPVLMPGQGSTDKARPVDCKAASAKSNAACQGKTAPAKAGADTKAVPADTKAAPDVFAFPEEQSKHGADAAGMPTSGVPDPPAESEKPLPRDGSSSSSSSSSSSASGDGGSGGGSAPSDDDADVAPTTVDPHARVKAAPLKDLGSKGDMSADRKKLEATRVDDDVRVGEFYLKDHNPQGAYMRFKDAVERDAGDPDAQFGLAESARKLNILDEAAMHYRECLKIDADGDHAKAARKALAQLGAQAKR